MHGSDIDGELGISYDEQAIWSSTNEFGRYLRAVIDELTVGEEGSDALYDLETMNQALAASGFKLEVQPLSLTDDTR